MAKLVKCSLCGRDVSSECRLCPGCGHNVAHEIKQNWKAQGLCKKCGNDNFVKKNEPKYTFIALKKIGTRVYAECTACGDYDNVNYIEIVDTDNNEGYSIGTEVHGQGLKFGLRKIKE